MKCENLERRLFGRHQFFIKILLTCPHPPTSNLTNGWECMSQLPECSLWRTWLHTDPLASQEASQFMQTVHCNILSPESDDQGLGCREGEGGEGHKNSLPNMQTSAKSVVQFDSSNCHLKSVQWHRYTLLLITVSQQWPDSYTNFTTQTRTSNPHNNDEMLRTARHD